jgi:hypothetical protein
VYIVYIVHIPLYHKSKVIIVVSSYLEVDSFALLSRSRFSMLHRIKCLKSPEPGAGPGFLEWVFRKKKIAKSLVFGMYKGMYNAAS